jgi:antitoxin FitA
VRGRQRKVATGMKMRYHDEMQLPVDLTDAQLESLRDRAKSLGISPEQLASAAVADLVERPADDFQRAASKVLSKNAELYRRLAR